MLPASSQKRVTFDDQDLKLLRLLQEDASLSLDRLAKKVNASKTAVWNRIQRLEREGIIEKRVAVINADAMGLTETVFVAVRTAQHNQQWLQAFIEAIRDTPEILEAHRLAGEIDYLLKVKVSSTREFDAFYKRLIERIDLFNVTSSLSMETMKNTTKLPI